MRQIEDKNTITAEYTDAATLSWRLANWGRTASNWAVFPVVVIGFFGALPGMLVGGAIGRLLHLPHDAMFGLMMDSGLLVGMPLGWSVMWTVFAGKPVLLLALLDPIERHLRGLPPVMKEKRS